MANAAKAGDLDVVDRLYEAAVLPDRMPGVLQDIADTVGARGGLIISRSPAGMNWIVSPRIARIAEDYLSEGWAADEDYAAPLLADLFPGFRTELDYRTLDEIERMPIHAEFFAPRGFVAGAGTVLQGIADHTIQLAFEGFPSHEAAATAIASLDRLRPHFGRAIGLTVAMAHMQANTIVSALGLGGMGAALVSSGARLRTSNALFAERLGNRVSEVNGRLRFADAFLNRQFATALAQARQDGVQSIAVSAQEGGLPIVVHIVPILRMACEVFDTDGLVLLVSDGANSSLPGADLLRLLFDLTPAEALLARRIGEGLTLAEAAKANSIGQETARTHLRRIFAKTGVRRQADLVRFLMALRQPDYGTQ